MTEGTSTFMGLAVPLFGESEVKGQTAATDIITLTGAASQSGDFLVIQNSTGGELAVLNCYGAITLTISSTLQTAGLQVNVTSTGAIAAGSDAVNGVVVVASTKSVLNDVFAYHGTAEGTAQSLLGVTSTHAPTYFLRVAASGGTDDVGKGAALANGFLTPPNFYYVSAPSTAIPMGAIKILAGSKAYYIPIIPDTGMAAS